MSSLGGKDKCFRYYSGTKPKESLMLSKLKTAFLWAKSPEGRKDLGAAVAALTALYTALHRAGV